jgi:hypothetical protein
LSFCLGSLPSLLPNFKPKSFKRPFAARNELHAVAGAAGEQATDHDSSESGEAAPHISKPAPAPICALAGKGADKQPELQSINLM